MSKENHAPSSTSQFKNDHLTVDLTKKPGCIASLNIEVSPSATAAAWEKAVKKINKEVNIPGFRPGKAPADHVLKNYSSFIEKEWKELLLDLAFKEAISLTKTAPFRQESIKKAELKKASKEEGATALIEFESFPNLPEINFSSIELKKKQEKDVTAEDVDLGIYEFSLNHAVWKEQEREIQEGDFVDLTIQNLDDPLNPFICKKTRFHVAPKKMGAWMKKILLGKKAGESVEGVSEKTEGEALDLIDLEEFKPTHCLLTIHKVLEAELPALDDELAKKGGVETFDILKEKVKEFLTQKEKENAMNLLRAQLEDKLIKDYPFDIPESLIQQDVKDRFKELVAHNKKLDEESLRKEIKEEALKSYRLLFLLQETAHRKGIQVSEQEYMGKMIQMFSNPSENMLSLLQNPEQEKALRSKIMFDLTNEKALDSLLEEISIK